MATNFVSALGAGSGVDVKSLAESLVEAERAPRKDRIDKKIASSEAKISGYAAMKYALSNLKTAFAKIDDASDFSSIQPANTQPAAFGTTATTSAEADSYSIDVLQTALAQRTASNSFAARSTSLNGGASFELNLSVGGTSKGSITVATATPAGMVAAINSADLGITAQLINTGNGYQVVVSGETGADNAFSLSHNVTAVEPSISTQTDTSLEVSAATDATSVSVSYDDGNGGTTTLALEKSSSDGLWRPATGATIPPASASLTLTAVSSNVLPTFSQSLQTATDASIKVNGLSVTRSSNSINDVIDGVTLELYANTTTNVSARLDLNRDTAAIKGNIQGLVSAYNDFEDTLKILGDSASKVADFGGVLAGETLLESVRTKVRCFITGTSSNPGTTIKAARDVGISLDRYGKLTLNETALDTALQDNFAEVSTMFTAGTSNKSVYSDASAGVAGAAVRSIDKLLRTTGSIEAQSQSTTKQISKYKAELTVLSDRMEKLMTRYLGQFSVMESIVGSANSTRSGLKSTFDGMMRSSN